jgi:hypothetical protein
MENRFNWAEHATAYSVGQSEHYAVDIKIFLNKSNEWECKMGHYNVSKQGVVIDTIATPKQLRALYLKDTYFKTKEEALAAWETHCKIIGIKPY